MKKNNEQKKLIYLFIGAFFIMIIMMFFRSISNAEEPYFPMGQDDNSLISDTFVSYCETTYDSVNNDILICYYNKDSNYYNVVVYVVPRSNAVLYAEILSNGYQFQPYFSNISDNLSDTQVSNSITLYWLDVRISDYAVWPVQSTVFQSSTFNSSLYANNCSYSSNFRLYKDNNKTNVVLNYGSSDPVLDVGVAIIPPNAFVPDYPTGTTPPAQVPPVYTPTDYQWTTPPTFDGSTITNAIGSIQNTLGWLANNLKEEFKNITDNGKHFFEYIGKTIQYYGNAIIETLNNLIQNFYDNMKSLVEPIYTKIEGLYNDFLEFADLFINPFDEEEFENQIDNCQLITQYNELLDNCEVLQQIFNETSEPDSFILYIDFENPFADSEHKIIHGEINFNWLVPLRPVYRPFLQVFVLIECFVGGFRILGNIIGGKAK